MNLEHVETRGPNTFTNRRTLQNIVAQSLALVDVRGRRIAAELEHEERDPIKARLDIVNGQTFFSNSKESRRVLHALAQRIAAGDVRELMADERRCPTARHPELRMEGIGPRIAGYGAVFYDGTPDTEYALAEGVVERIKRGAFDSALSRRDDVRALFNHNADQILGRTASGTLRLSVDPVGLRYVIVPNHDDQLTTNVVSYLRRGDVSGSSFSFSILAESWNRQPDGLIVRTIEDTFLYDVGPVVFPAYKAASASVRDRLPDVTETTDDADDSPTPTPDEIKIRARLVEIENAM